MFTGIIQTIGRVVSLEKMGDWTFVIAPEKPLAELTIGASVAHNGVCLTIIHMDAQNYTVQVSSETIRATTLDQWKIGTRVNLERPLRMGDELGGHLVLGHVDGVARIVARKPEVDSVRLDFEVPQNFARFLASKGSIALDGVSLTLNGVEGARADVNIIPHTQSATTLGERLVGDCVNFEVDMMARYADRLLNKGLDS